MKVKKNLFIGTAGWNFDHWGKGVFYPPELPQGDWLEFYSKHYITVEINSTFYNTPKSNVFEHWRSSVGKNFKFAVRMNKFITHEVKLKNPEEHLSKFYEPCSALEDNLGPILFQFDHHFPIKNELLKETLEYTKNQIYIRKPKLVFEFRNRECLTEEVFNILREYNAALCFSDYQYSHVSGPETADFIYVRKHGPTAAASSLYTQEQLKEEAERIKNWRDSGKEVYVYFNNDSSGFALQNAKELYEMV